ncbi:MAG TPA: cell division protein FtsZ, partial [Candidatus Thermoplasmatota archaeon]|nr:cell division protein FtsZ [Candidatus Thermoplasmatota archaeon]
MIEAAVEETELKERGGFGEPKIVIVGCGGAGGNTVNRLHKVGVRGAETIAINTDKQALDLVEADKRLLIGKTITRGLGTGGDLEIAKQCAEQARGKLEEMLKGADLVFITAGMGGGTGTGTAPVVADVAKKMGAIVVGMVSTPFNVERARIIRGDEGLQKLRSRADSVIVLDNNRLLKYVPNLPIDQAFSVMDQLIAETVKGISETITQPSLINLDYA